MTKTVMGLRVEPAMTDNLRKYLGDETEAFLSKLEPCLEKYTKLWRLSQLTFMPTDTVNLLFSCESEVYGSCVLKVCIPGPEVATEINCLRAYSGQGYVKLWDYDLVDNMLLLERIMPGDQMWAVKDYRKRAQLMADLIKDLPFIECEVGEYPTYRIQMEGLCKNLISMGGMEEPLSYLDKAVLVYDELKRKYQRKCLLHGDMHQENMLLDSNGSYTVIDPKGVVDDPVMETARFLMNEVDTPNNKDMLLEMVSIMAPIIGIPEADMLKSMYVDAALGGCWCLENHFPTQEAFEKEKQEILETCGFVYGLLSEKS